MILYPGRGTMRFCEAIRPSGSEKGFCLVFRGLKEGPEQRIFRLQLPTGTMVRQVRTTQSHGVNRGFGVRCF